MLQHGIRQTAEVASQMTSVERVLQYSNIEQEGAFESVPTKKPDRDWPKNGEVNFKQLYLQYTPSEAPTLRNLNIEIKPGEKVTLLKNYFLLFNVDKFLDRNCRKDRCWKVFLNICPVSSCPN